MAILKCKMCGGDMELTTEKTFGTCEFCGSTMTLPKVDDDQRAAALNRGNHFRRIGEFDRALAVYERILREDDTDAEAHWCCALSRFGIEYVEDPATYEYLPTCHRASFDSFLEDVDYLAAVAHSEGITRRQYQKDAAKIAEVQRGILATSQNTEPYDVFICYKESDEKGERTRDSLLAQDIYYQLTEQGRRVFFARITLEDVAGAQYEPYIFAALNSAKVMIVVGTKPEHLNAVWVKNEWSRFLAMMKKDHGKLLLPCYRDMDPYDMPEALAVLQSYDMSKIGFIQDLTRGIAKVLDANKKPEQPRETVVVQQTSAPNVAPLLKRAFMFLEDGDWNSANEYCEKVLDIEPENAEAYLGKLMAALRVKQRNDLQNCKDPFDGNGDYKKILRFGDGKLKSELTGYVERIKERNEHARLEGIYNHGKELMAKARNERDYTDAAQRFDYIATYKDSAALAQECRELRNKLAYELAMKKMAAANTNWGYQEAANSFKALGNYADAPEMAKKCEELAIEAVYQAERHHMSEAKTQEDFNAVARQFDLLGDYGDSAALAQACRKKAEEIRAKQSADLLERNRKAEAERLERERQAEIARREAARKAKRNKKLAIIAFAVLCVVVAVVILVNTVFAPMLRYNEAVALMDAGKYTEAIAAFEAMNGYQDSVIKIEECKAGILDDQYNDAIALLETGSYTEAIAAFEAMGSYRESQSKILECKYGCAVTLMEKGSPVAALHMFNQCADYLDAREKVSKLEAACRIALTETIDGGWRHTVGLHPDGTVEAVGWNDDGQCNVAGWRNIVSVGAGDVHTVGLKNDGTVVAIGRDAQGRCDVDDWEHIIAVRAGMRHTVGLKADGTVVAVGWNDDGQCNVSDWKDIVNISAGHQHTVGLKADGTVVAVGWNDYDQCELSAWKDIVAVSAGSYHTVGLKADGTVVAAGYNVHGQCNVTGWKDIVSVYAGTFYTVGLKADGTVVLAGDDDVEPVTQWKNVVALAGDFYHVVGLKANGTVVSVGPNILGECEVDGWKNIWIPENASRP